MCYLLSHPTSENHYIFRNLSSPSCMANVPLLAAGLAGCCCISIFTLALALVYFLSPCIVSNQRRKLSSCGPAVDIRASSHQCVCVWVYMLASLFSLSYAFPRCGLCLSQTTSCPCRLCLGTITQFVDRFTQEYMYLGTVADFASAQTLHCLYIVLVLRPPPIANFVVNIVWLNRGKKISCWKIGCGLFWRSYYYFVDTLYCRAIKWCRCHHKFWRWIL